ncbi:MAG: putative diguanylate cyclase AdrA [Firmicutes bacterium ADurb.Bin146]|nr:MAG: putative diguanylate cyclase AdrA [Firmicutes bacterium ADurb.Bin146]
MKHYSKAFTTVLAIAIVFVLWIAIAYNHSNISIKSAPLNPFPQMQLIKGEDETVYRAQTILTKDFDKPMALLFKTSHMRLKIYINDEMIYSFGYDENAIPFLKSPGTSYHLVKIPALSASKQLTINFQTPYSNYSGYIPYIQYGTEGECIADYQGNAIYALLSIMIILIGGFTTIVLYFITRHKKNSMSKSFLYISSFAFLVSIWLLFQSDSAQLLFGYPQVMYYIDLISLILFPIPLNIYIYSLSKNEKRKPITYLCYAYLVVLVLNIMLQLSGLVDMFQLVLLTHSLMAVNILFVIYLLYIELHIEKNQDLKKFVIPLIFIIIGGAIEMILYYSSHMTKTSIALRFAVVAFLIMIISNAIRSYYNSVLDLKQAEYYEKLANTDMLTDIGNRNKYEQVLSSHKQEEPLTAVLFDLNSLKYINDNYGHVIGDSVIKKCSECIKESFSSKGECFRIGGDEFAVLAKTNDSLEKECNTFDRLVNGWNNKLEFTFSVAYGVARFNTVVDKSAYDTVKRADFAMYHMKEEQKRKMMR